MPGHGRYMGAPSPVPDLRARGVLRRFEEQACHEALPLDAASDRDFARARRGLELVLRRRARHRARMKGGAMATTREKHSGLPIGEPVLGFRRSASDEKLLG